MYFAIAMVADAPANHAFAIFASMFGRHGSSQSYDAFIGYCLVLSSSMLADTYIPAITSMYGCPLPANDSRHDGRMVNRNMANKSRLFDFEVSAVISHIQPCTGDTQCRL